MTRLQPDSLILPSKQCPKYSTFLFSCILWNFQLLIIEFITLTLNYVFRGVFPKQPKVIGDVFLKFCWCRRDGAQLTRERRRLYLTTGWCRSSASCSADLLPEWLAFPAIFSVVSWAERDRPQCPSARDPNRGRNPSAGGQFPKRNP